eukprot:5998179-Prymnesium_polylepis.1
MRSATSGSLSECNIRVLIVEYLSGNLSMMSATSCSSVKQRREERLLSATIPAIWAGPTIGSRMTTPRFLTAAEL